MTIFSCHNISKSYTEGFLFKDISFGMEQGEKLGLIGRNGIGKTSLLKIIAGKESPDTGEVIFKNNVTLKYLEQNPTFNDNISALDYVLKANLKLYEALNEHQKLCNLLSQSYKENIQHKLEQLTQFIENNDGWNYENLAKSYLNKLNIVDYYQNVKFFSGGMKKRVALAKAILTNPMLLILDEPTNHLDASTVQWLQDTLMNSNISLLFVSHDRYFLDAISTKIIELDDKKLYIYPGNWEKYLIKKANIESVKKSTIEHKKSTLKKELLWLQKSARARRSKQKSKYQWIEELEKQIKKEKDRKIKIELGNTFLGKTIIDAHYISKSFHNTILFKDFTYIAKPGDRIGIIGPNGCGKSTLLNILAGQIKPDTGNLKIGPSVKIGYFTQENIYLNENQTLISTLKEISEYIDVGVGRERYITAVELLERFLFPKNMHNSFVSTLSGGEKRRLQILKVLMQNPNVLLLDEPTNDIDINTLMALENYLENFYGVLIIVSHDRAFLDKTVNVIWSFEKNGKIKEYPGNYSYYLEKIESNKNSMIESKVKSKVNENKDNYLAQKKMKNTNKLSYKENLELKNLEQEISTLEEIKKNLEFEFLKIDKNNFKEFNKISQKIDDIDKMIKMKFNTWVSLVEKSNELILKS